MKKRSLVAAIAGVAISGGVIASAASLGGVDSADLGSSTTVVAACDSNGVTLDYTTSYSAATGIYGVSAVKVGGIDANCMGQDIEVSLKNADGTVTASTVRTAVTGATQTLAINLPGEAVTSAAVLIQG